MPYAVTTQFDSRMPTWRGNGTPFTLIACHDTEGGQGRVGALGTIRFLIDTAAQRGASYHEIWWYHEDTDEFGAIRIVPPHLVSGSINPRTPPYYPTQWVKDSLAANWRDPNQGVYAVSIAGRVADVDRYSRNPKFLAHAHRRMMELWKELGITKRAEHFQFQPGNRSDWGKLLMPALGGLVTSDRYTLPDTTMEAPMPTLMPIPPTKMTIRPETSIRLLPDLSDASKPWKVGKVATVTAIARVPDGFDFGSGPVWYAYVINTGGLRYFHEQDVTAQAVLGDSSALDAQIESLKSQVATLQTKVNSLEAVIRGQTDSIAGLKTELSEAQAALVRVRAELAAAEEARESAEAAADEATALAEGAVVLRDALRNFMG